MSHTINMLAKRNIQKYKKHYLIVLIVLLIVSTFIFSSFFIVALFPSFDTITVHASWQIKFHAPLSYPLA